MNKTNDNKLPYGEYIVLSEQEARLYNAAPDLLAALRFAKNQLELLAPPGSDERKLAFPAISEARAAIAAAEKGT